MTPRRIRVAGVRGDFLTPRGWPTPTDHWIRANTFWQPPPGWVPVPGLPPAPDGWRFWTTNKTWDAAAAKHYAPLNAWMRAFTIAAFATWATPIAASAAQLPALRPAGVAFALIAVICLTVHTVKRRRLTKKLLAHATSDAERVRNERLAREYQRYLMDAV